MTRAGKTGHQCYHCKHWVEAGEAHDCWTTTEAALTQELPEDLCDAWERLRETAVEFGDQRIYASHKSIMFARKACYFFVRPSTRRLEVWFFLGRAVKAPQIRRVERSSQTKLAHLVHVTHRDEVEAPITDWLREAYDTSEQLSAASRRTRGAKTTAKKTTAKKTTAKKKAATKKAPTTSAAKKKSVKRTANG